jgi:hypothetical protein
MTKANSSDPNKLDDGFGNVWSKCERGDDRREPNGEMTR